MKAEQDWERLDTGFVLRTYRSTAVMAAFILLYLAARNWGWAVLPTFCGTALSLLLLYANEHLFARMLNRQAEMYREGRGAVEKKYSRSGSMRTVGVIALIKYLSVGVIAWLVVRVWTTPQIAAFAAGFCLVPLNITLRVVSRLWIARMNKAGK